MISLDNNTKAFIELVKAGLWCKEVQLSQYGEIDFSTIYQLAEEQSVTGLVTAGLENVKDVKIPREVVLQFIGTTLQIEQRNKELNEFVAKLIKRLQSEDVFSLVVKGQGIAQCYEKPLWRVAGDVDLLLDDDNYEKAKNILLPIAYDIQKEDVSKKHQAMKIMGVDLELHGRMPFEMSEKADMVIDEVIDKAVLHSWINVYNADGTDWKDVRMPRADEHVFLVFTHYLHHFFIEGVGVRQICDWCRMLWTYREVLNYGLLESRIKASGLKTEWQVFGTLAVEFLGMPKDAMLFVNQNENLRRKAKRVMKRVLKTGNFGHNNDLSYRSMYKGTKYKIVSLWRRFCDFASLYTVFSTDTLRFFVAYVRRRL